MRHYILLSLLTLVAVSVSAQEKLSRQVEVTKDFTPDVDKASKKDVPPTMYDTVKLKPEIRYSIAPKTSPNAIKIDTIAAAGIATNTFSPGTPLFIRLGGGYPLNSLADIYFSKIYEQGSNFGAYINHDGYWGKLKNEMGDELDAKDYSVKAGLFGTVNIGKHYKFESDATVLLRGVDKYGLLAIEQIPLPSYGAASRAKWLEGTYNLAFGDDFTDLSRVNFRIEAGVYLLGDNNKNREYSYNIGAKVGKAFNRHAVTLKATWLATNGAQGDIDGYKDNMLTFSPRYEHKGNKFDIEAGIDVTINDNDVWVFPQAKLTWNVATGAFVPYIEARGTMTQNSYRNTLAQNPYTRAGWVMPTNEEEYLILAGVSGDINAKFNYKAYAGFDIMHNKNWFTQIYNEGSTNDMGYVTESVSLLKIGGNIDWSISPSLRAELGVDYQGVLFTDIPKAFNLPNLTSKIEVTYNYRSRFEVAMSGCFATPRKIYAIGTKIEETLGGLYESKTSSTFDLGLRAKWNISQRVGVFANATNLLGAKLYPYGYYVGRGATITAGITLNF